MLALRRVESDGTKLN